MNVLQITPSFYPAFVYGGTTYSVYALCTGLASAGCVVRVLTTNANGPQAVLDTPADRDVELLPRLSVRYCRRIADVSISLQLLRLLPGAIRAADVVHLTAVYSFPTIPTLFLCRCLKKPIVWSPRGMLQRWPETSRAVLKTLWERICKAVAPKTTVLHCTSDEEAAQSRLRMPGMKVAIVPNGVDVSNHPPDGEVDEGLVRPMHFLYLGRLHPKKGIENLLQAFATLNGLACTLTIAGEGEAKYRALLEQTVESLQIQGRVKLLGFVEGESKEAVYASADSVVIPSFTENFGMVVAEALAHGIPVIASRGTPWRRVEEIGCGLWVNNNPESIAAAMKKIASMPLRDMGRRGREWMAREFSVEATTQQMIRVYTELLDS